MKSLHNQLYQVSWRVATLLALGLLTEAASAQPTAEQQSAIRSNCRSDFMSKCSGVTPGGKDALMCLQKNVASLSPNCQKAVSVTIPAPAPVEAKPIQAAPAPAAARAAPPAPATAAPAPAPAAVTTTPPKQAQQPAAPKRQQVQRPVPPPKQAVVAPAVAAPVAAPPAGAAPLPTEQQMKAIRFTCRREFAKNCRGVPPGGAEAIHCLMRNAAKLTPDCTTSLAALGDAMPPTAGTPPPVATRTPNAPVVMTAVIGRACARDLVLHCNHVKVGEGRKIACLTERGPALAPACQAALKITERVR